MIAPATSPAAIHFNRVRAGAATDGHVAPCRGAAGRRRQRARDRRGGLEPFDPRQQRQRFVARGAVLDRRRDQLPRRAGVAPIERRHAGVEQLVALALPLGDARCAPVRCRRAPAHGRDR